MNILLFGASGMVGQGVLRECLRDPDVKKILLISRTPSAEPNPKVQELIHPDLFHYTGIESQLTGFDACFFCLGVSSAGLKPEAYERITYGITLAAAESLVRLNPQMVFTYVSGAGTDSTEIGRVSWARIKGKTENALLRLPFRAAYMLRPGLIVPLHGIRSKTRSYRIIYSILQPIQPLLRRLFPNHVVTTEELGRLMLILAREGYSKRILETADIRAALTQR